MVIAGASGMCDAGSQRRVGVNKGKGQEEPTARGTSPMYDSGAVTLREGACCAPGSAQYLRSVALHDVDGPQGEAWCASACVAEPRCTFLSFSGGRQPNTCELCSGCVLNRRNLARSWPRGWHGCARHSIPAIIGEILGEHLQGTYSRQLYRRPGLVRLRELRILFAEMLPRSALRALAAVGVCKAEASPPFHPFYWGHDIYANPRNSIWIHRTEGPQPAANHSWLEVTHCAQFNGMRGGSNFPFWAYAAPGSGISMNVGRTLVADSYAHATWLLRQTFPKRAVGGMMVSHVGGRAHPHGERTVASIPLAGLDTLQILNHREYHSIEARHEVVFLAHREHDDLLATRLPGLMCGRYPHLFACADHELARMSNCTAYPAAISDASHWLRSQANVRRLFGAHRRCNTSHAAKPSYCYSEHAERWGDYLCCGKPPVFAASKVPA